LPPNAELTAPVHNPFAVPFAVLFLQEMVFPTFLRYQQVKISASGQEIGGDILFKRRIGFSGTPSALLPLEMGETLFVAPLNTP
jgi:hypothetical protein